MNNNELQCKFYTFENQKLGRLNMIIAKEIYPHRPCFCFQSKLVVAQAMTCKDSINDTLYNNLERKKRLAEACYKNSRSLPDSVILDWFGVNVDYRDKNLGRDTMQGLIQDLRENGCTSICGTSTQSSAPFYRAIGLNVAQHGRIYSRTTNPLIQAPADKFTLDEKCSEWATEILNDKGNLFETYTYA